MDPLSITTAVLRITTTCVVAAKELNEIRNAWKRAPVTVSSLCSQLKLTASSLSQIQTLLLDDTDILHAKPALVETFDTTLTSCLVLSSWLEKYMLKITKGVLGSFGLSWKAKFKTLWNEAEGKELLEQLHQQHGAIGTLVGLLQMDSLSEMKKIIREHGKMLRRISRDTKHMREAHAIEVAESILGTDDSTSILGKLPTRSNADGRSFEKNFESVILNSKVYSKAFNNTIKQALDVESDDAKTVAGDAMTVPDTNSDSTIEIPGVKQDQVPTQTIARLEVAPFSALVKSALTSLHVGSTRARYLRGYSAQSPKELSYSERDMNEHLEKINKEWYHGTIVSSPKIGSQGSGIVSRRNLLVRWHLDVPLRVTTSGRTSYNRESINQLCYVKGDAFEIIVSPRTPYS